MQTETETQLTSNTCVLQAWHPSGIWLPLITPFLDGALDTGSLDRLTRHCIGLPINGLILCATTGESLSLTSDEKTRMLDIVQQVRREMRPEIPIFMGISGSDTRMLCAEMQGLEDWDLDGYLINCPAYNRPSQEGLYRHFEALLGETERPCILYNIPYRSGVNVENGLMRRLAAFKGIVGVKDCCANPAQSFELMRDPPEEFHVMTGEDGLFYTALVHGGRGGIVMAGHILSPWYDRIFRHVHAGELAEALDVWTSISDIPPLLFAEPSPAPIKYWLWRKGLIDSPELRLPMMRVSDGLAERLDPYIEALDQRALSLST